MEELEVLSEYMLIVSRIYEKVVYCVYMGDGISDLFDSTIGIKQGYPLSTTLFGLCIDEFEQMVAKFVKEEGIVTAKTRIC